MHCPVTLFAALTTLTVLSGAFPSVHQSHHQLDPRCDNHDHSVAATSNVQPDAAHGKTPPFSVPSTSNSQPTDKKKKPSKGNGRHRKPKPKPKPKPAAGKPKPAASKPKPVPPKPKPKPNASKPKPAAPKPKPQIGAAQGSAQPQNPGQRTAKSGQVNPNPVENGMWEGAPLTNVPATCPGPGKFSNGAAPRTGMPPEVNDSWDATPKEYQCRTIDLPFERLHKGKLKFFKHTNSLSSTDGSDSAPGVDNAEMSACGIPFNAYFISHVAIHPYFLKYAPLERICMADVGISFWQLPENGPNDMMLKVTDICCTDTSRPECCHSPAEIKIDRVKAKIVNGLDYTPAGDEYPQEFHWFFMKNWGDGIPETGYVDNWFNKPAYGPNNSTISQHWASEQYKRNQDPNTGYPSKGWPTYKSGAYYLPAEGRDALVYHMDDWVPGLEPGFTPIAGGAQSKY